MAQSDIDQSSQVVLEKLDDLLKDCTPLLVEDAHGMDYTAGLVEIKKVCSSYVEKLAQMLSEKACALVKAFSTTSMEEPFRILSIGCGDGTFDAKILQAIIDKFPEVSIHYVGTDIDEQTCQKAAEVLDALKSQNVTTEILTVDFEKIDSFKMKIPPCDLVMAVHSLYYMKDLKKALSDAQAFQTDEGSMIIILQASKCPTIQLQKRFFEHERKWPMKFYDNFVEILNHLGITYETEVIDGEQDYTDCFRDGFQKPHQKYLLDFITLAKTANYPQAISEACVCFLTSACVHRKKPDQHVVPFSTSVIIV